MSQEFLPRDGMPRRAFLKAAGLTSLAVGLGACGSGGGSNAGTAAGGTDLAPASAAEQFVRIAATQSGTGWKSMDQNEQAYSLAPLHDMFSESLTRLDHDYGIIPGMAESWRSDASGQLWTFTLRRGLQWSNGDAVTADDYIATLRYDADPRHAWDFAGYFSGVIKNFGEINQGHRPISSLGVRRGATPQELVVETEHPVPYMPALMTQCWPLNRTALAKYGGGSYNLNPRTCVSAGPYVLEEWNPDSRISIRKNNAYRGSLTPRINRYIATVVSGGSDLQRYLAGEVDRFDNPDPGELKQILADSGLKSQLHISAGDFRCFYTFFDVSKKPFDDPRVRLAFAKAIDRDQIVTGILAPLAIPAYGFLAPGFPDSNQAGLRDIQAFDPAKAKQLLADAGYPGGKGFPQITLVVRGGGPPTDSTVTQAVVASINQTLGLKVGLQTKDAPAFMTALANRPTGIQFGWISYGFDYFDASNMLGVWAGAQRHNWEDRRYDRLVADASELNGEPARRTQMMQEAERLLVSQAPGAFVYFALQGQMHKPYRQAAYFQKNRYGYNGSLGGLYPVERTNTDELSSLYITQAVPSSRHA